MNKSDKYWNIAALIGLVLALGYMGTEDYKDQAQQDVEYCAGVKNGEFPDYAGNYATRCHNGLPKKD